MTGNIWTLVSTHPLFGLVLTIAVYAAANRIYLACGQLSLLHPVMTTIAVVALVVSASGIRYADYLTQAAPLHHGLSLLVVVLAIPLLRQLPRLRADCLPITLSLVAGSFTAMITALAPAALMEAAPAVSASLAPKSTTAAVAVGIAERLGGVIGLTAVVVIVTGIAGAVFGPSLLRLAGVRDERAVGLALGLASHGIGTARAFQISERTGAYATVGMILNVLLTVVLAPIAFRFVMP
jgi:putative effector of murein hydrolase